MSTNRKDPSVVIIGAGMTGILLVIKLRQAGINNITLLEKEATIGGTWRKTSTRMRSSKLACCERIIADVVELVDTLS